MDYVEDIFTKIGELISIVVGNIAQFILGPLPRFVLRLGLPYLVLLGVTLITSVIFSLFGFTVMVSPISTLVAIAIISILMLMAFIFRKGGERNDTDERCLGSHQHFTGIPAEDVTEHERYGEQVGYTTGEDVSQSQY